ncbi:MULTISPECIES: saccharopine dehydrogenase NADP-binding domain-containing protein [Streptomyces]|uniref:saccharopine dehydrogenase family protein n=1 Tax=Streptomyces TaxID=1883 RepID=UPI0034239C4D|nr:saccharopine dehydrogenase NADP-binding domain-containing protein [Streptomyces sp. NBC_00887]WSY36304.1 saccharopine dehydrogenase NADP-binding domain-containing protein [Streptomyces sp. NBC_00887]
MKIAVYGANGYTGKLMIEELRRRGFDMVLSGRNATRLRAAADGAGAGDAELRIADADDEPALAEAFHGCDAVINCAGPFISAGEPVVRAAIAAGCHYVDTSAEQLFLQRVFDTYAEDAERAGVSVIPAMGYDILLGDMIAHLTGQRTGPVEELTVAYRVGEFDMTRGTIRSAVEMIRSGDVVYEDGQWRAGGIPAKRTSFAYPGDLEESPTLRWPGAEVITVPRHVPARRVEVIMDAAAFTPEMSALLQSPADELDTFVSGLPEGPSGDRRPAATFTIVAEALGEDGRKARGELRGTDIYGITAVIAVEGVRRLVADGAPGGVLTPAQGYDCVGFLDFLAPHGITWNVAITS